MLRSLLVVGCSILALSGRAFAQGMPGTSTRWQGFVLVDGKDTVGVERYRTTPSAVTGDQFLVDPGIIIHYTATLDAQGRIVRLDAETRSPRPDPTDAPAILRRTRIDGRRASIEVVIGGRADSLASGRREVPVGSLPVLPYELPSYALLAHILRTAGAHLRPGGDTVVIPMITTTHGPLPPMRLAQRQPRDRGGISEYLVSFDDTPLDARVVRVGRGGRMLGIDASRAPERIAVMRVDDPPFDRLVRAFKVAKTAVADRGPRIGARLPPLVGRDQFGVQRDFASLTGPRGLVVLFFRSADW